MSEFSKSGAYDRAIALVTAALQAKSIKLEGATANDDYNEQHIAADSKYLNGLINALANNLTARGE